MHDRTSGQVHRARLHDGREAAVKIQYVTLGYHAPCLPCPVVTPLSYHGRLVHGREAAVKIQYV